MMPAKVVQHIESKYKRGAKEVDRVPAFLLENVM